MKPRKWTLDEEEFVRKHYGRMSAAEIARQLGRKTPMVFSKAYSMGLRRKPDLMSREEFVALVGRVVEQMQWEEAQQR